MSYQKLLPCPTCKDDQSVYVYKYESGWAHVECMKCDYLGPGEGRIGDAIKSHNARMRAPALTGNDSKGGAA